MGKVIWENFANINVELCFIFGLYVPYRNRYCVSDSTRHITRKEYPYRDCNHGKKDFSFHCQWVYDTVNDKFNFSDKKNVYPNIFRFSSYVKHL